jgi:hypothetical protein
MNGSRTIGGPKEEFMLRPDDPWFLDEDVDEFVEMLKALPEIRQRLEPAPPEEELGLRSLLEQPDTLAHTWWHDQASSNEPTLRPTRPRAA